MTRLTIYVPAEGNRGLFNVKPGSGIVGPELPEENGRVTVDFEGNLHDAVNMRTYEERVYHAASRQLWNDGKGYPTVARRWVEPTDLITVGTIDVDTETWAFRIEITDQARVDAWNAS